MTKYPFTVSKRRKNKYGIQVWQIRFQYNLKSYTNHFAGSKQDAIKKGLSLYQDVINGLVSDPSNATFKQYWLDTFTDHHISPLEHGTRYEYQGNFTRYFEKPLGNLKLKNIKPLHINNLFANLRKRGLKEGTLAIAYAYLNKSFNYAVENEFIARNPMLKISKPKPKKTKADNFTPVSSDTIVEFLEYAKEHHSDYYPSIAFDWYTGLRRSEIVAIRFDSIDIDNATVKISQSVESKKRPYPIFKFTGKTDGTFRTHHLSPEAVEILNLQKLLNDSEPNPKQFVFTSYKARNKYGLIHIDQLTRVFKTIVKALNLPEDFTFHSARHQLATDLNRLGATAKDIQEHLGHSTITTTMNMYTHTTDTTKQNTAKLLSERFTNE